MMYKPLPRHPLGFFPTPIAELRRLSKRLGGPRILVKRDDLTGLAFGGNKTRKLEILVAEALAQGCDTLITGGAGQSNHCRQTAAAAAACGLACHLVLGGEEPPAVNGNLLIDRLIGARIHWTGELRKGEKIPEIAEELRSAGAAPYIIPYGASNPTGATAFVEAAREVKEQLARMGERISHVVFPSSSGGTQAGLIVGRALFGESYGLVGIGVDKGEAGEAPYEERVRRLAEQTAERCGAGITVSPSDIIVRKEYLGAGYGVVGEPEREAIRLLAAVEGLLLDPVYTGRAMAGLIDMVTRGEFGTNDTILFWHTGGTPALFPHARDLL